MSRLRAASIDPRSHAMSSAQAMSDARKLEEIFGRMHRRKPLADSDKLALFSIFDRLPASIKEGLRFNVEVLAAGEIGRAIAQLGGRL
jgi:hypothetical protein